MQLFGIETKTAAGCRQYAAQVRPDVGHRQPVLFQQQFQLPSPSGPGPQSLAQSCANAGGHVEFAIDGPVGHVPDQGLAPFLHIPQGKQNSGREERHDAPQPLLDKTEQQMQITGRFLVGNTHDLSR